MKFVALTDSSFHLTLRGHCRVISIFISENREAQGEGERWGNGGPVEQSEHIHLLSLSSYIAVVGGARKQLQYHRSPKHIVIMKKFEILRELPKCDREMK